MEKKYLITSALPYANGPLHFGHLAGAYLPADIIVRHRRLQGKKVKYICGSDEHGVSIMLNAKKANKDYKAYVDEWHRDHKDLFTKYQIEFDFFGQTSASYHDEEVKEWFKLIYDKGYIGKKNNQQLFCNDCKNHLPDRFVEGTCYECGYEQARGDECPNCGIWIEPEKLGSPICKICGSQKIEEITVSQYYLLLSKYHKEFRKWFEQKSFWRKTVYPFVDSLTKEELQDRAITRDLDWGIDVPLDEAKGKKLYVWFDAPIGYVSNLKQHLKEVGSNEDYLKDWWQDENTDILHFIGKDNIIFHTIIFPIMGLISGRINPPYDVPANQYLNFEGKQFSKSAGHVLDAKEAIDQFGVDALRYYLVSLIPENADTVFTWDGLQTKVNNELANNIGNLVNRCLKFAKKSWPNGISSQYFQGFHQSEHGKEMIKKIKKHTQHLNSVQIKKGMEVVMSIGHDANNFFSDRAPWAQIKEDENLAAQTIAWSAMQIFTLGILLSPYLPTLGKNILDHYPTCNKEDAAKIYQGDLEILEKIFDNGLKIEKKPKALVPKIEDDAIKMFKE